MPSAAADNANPVIHTTSSARRNRKRADSLDLSDDETWERRGKQLGGSETDEDEDGEIEPIDSEEIFGEWQILTKNPTISPATFQHRSWGLLSPSLFYPAFPLI